MTLPVTPSFRLDGRRALITGASKGIGFACAVALASAGAHVTLAARSRDELEAAAEEIRAAGFSADILCGDVSDVAAMSAAIAAAAPFDVLVNNAGANRPKPIAEISEDDYDAVFGLNMRAAYFVAKAVTARLMEAGKPGSLIHMSSQMGHVGAVNRTLYCASKWALEGFNKALAVELAPHGIRSNTIAPTFIETPLTKPFLADPAFRASVLSKIKLGRLGAVSDVMGAVVFLASDASGLVTGTSLVVDGGWTAE